MTDLPLRIAIWCAVSSKAQAADDKVSLEEQERAGREFAARLDGQVVALYRVAHTRDLIFYHDAERQMDAYRDLRLDVEGERLDVLWALDIDRLGRDPALQQQVISLVEKNRASEVYLESSPHVVGQKSFGHRYLESVQGVSAAEEQARRRRRHRSGMKGRIEKRGLIPGRIPFYLDPIRDDNGAVLGYRLNDQVAVMELATRLYLDGLPYAEITRRLQESGFRPPEGRRWWHQSVRLLLLSDVPAGIVAWGPYAYGQPSPHIEALWDEETVAAVRRERLRRQRDGHRRRGRSLYDNVAFCSRCGRPMRQMIYHGGRYVYMRCSGHAMKAVYPEMACHPNYTRIEVITAALVEKFKEIASRPRALEELLAEFGAAGDEGTLRAELARCRSTIEDLHERQRRLGHVLARGEIHPAVYRQVDDDLLAELEGTEERLMELERELAFRPDRQGWQTMILWLATEFARIVETMQPAEIATFLYRAGIRIECDGGQVQRIRLVVR